MTPLLLIDVGNTHTKWAEATARGAIRVRGQLATGSVNQKHIAVLAKKFPLHRVVITSVVPKISRMFRIGFPKAVFVSGMLSGLPLGFDYPKPDEIGADRVAAAIGAKTCGPAIIVSCGTATAFSVLDKRGRFCGGAIAPGLEVQLHALLGATAQLPATTLAGNPRALGRSTRAAIQAGVLLGYQGGVREIVQQLRKELGFPARIIVTGGDAQRLRGIRGLGRVEFRPLLVFEGLRIIADTIFEP